MVQLFESCALSGRKGRWRQGGEGPKVERSATPEKQDTGNGYPYDPRATGRIGFRARAQSILKKVLKSPLTRNPTHRGAASHRVSNLGPVIIGYAAPERERLPVSNHGTDPASGLYLSFVVNHD